MRVALLSFAILCAICSCKANKGELELNPLSSSFQQDNEEQAFLNLKFDETVLKKYPDDKFEITVSPLEMHDQGTSYIGTLSDLSQYSFNAEQEYIIVVTIFSEYSQKPILNSEECGERLNRYLSPGKNSFYIEVCPIPDVNIKPFSYN